jgi:hypothetical protein
MPRSAMIMSAAGDEAAARRSSQAARARKAGCTRIRSGLCLTLLLVSVIGGVLPASAQTSTVVVLLDDPGWSPLLRKDPRYRSTQRIREQAKARSSSSRASARRRRSSTR